MDYKEYMTRIKNNYNNPYIQIPNNLIPHLNRSLGKHNLQRYTDYGFSFLVVSGFLYKYTHYVDYDKKDYILLRDIKRMLKYNPNNQGINRVSKAGDGALHYESLVEVTRDIPLTIEYLNGNGGSLRKRTPLRMSEVDWIVSDEVKHNILKSSNHQVYIPEYMIDYSAKKGTLNNYKNTSRITFLEFEYFILSDKMTLKDFLVYCYIKTQSTKSGGTYISYDRAQRGMGISRATFIKVSKKLEYLNIIKIKKSKNSTRFKKTPNKFTITPSFVKKYA